jgi:hypothetical protein
MTDLPILTHNLSEAEILVLRLLCHEVHHLNTSAVLSYHRSSLIHDIAEVKILILSLLCHEFHHLNTSAVCF